jgi:hypothetical protein
MTTDVVYRGALRHVESDVIPSKNILNVRQRGKFIPTAHVVL